MRAGALAACLLVPVAVLTGCASAPPDDEPVDEDPWIWMAYGIFTRDWTKDDERAVCAAAGRAADECGFMASLPPQFGFGYPTAAACEAARARIDAVPHTLVRPCGPDWQMTPYGAAQWVFSGTFTTERTSDDMRKVCLAGWRNETCAFAESFPEQYGFSFASEQLCEDARRQVLAVPHVARVSECRSEGGDFPPEATGASSSR